MNLFPNMEAAAIVNTIGCGGKQSCLCSQGCCLRWLMCPLAPIGASGVGEEGEEESRLSGTTHDKNKEPRGWQGKVAHPYCVLLPSPARGCFSGSDLCAGLHRLPTTFPLAHFSRLVLKRLMTTDKKICARLAQPRKFPRRRAAPPPPQQNTGNSSPSRVFVC